MRFCQALKRQTPKRIRYINIIMFVNKDLTHTFWNTVINKTQACFLICLCFLLTTNVSLGWTTEHICNQISFFSLVLVETKFYQNKHFLTFEKFDSTFLYGGELCDRETAWFIYTQYGVQYPFTLLNCRRSGCWKNVTSSTSRSLKILYVYHIRILMTWYLIMWLLPEKFRRTLYILFREAFGRSSPSKDLKLTATVSPSANIKLFFENYCF